MSRSGRRPAWSHARRAVGALSESVLTTRVQHHPWMCLGGEVSTRTNTQTLTSSAVFGTAASLVVPQSAVCAGLVVPWILLLVCRSTVPRAVRAGMGMYARAAAGNGCSEVSLCTLDAGAGPATTCSHPRRARSHHMARSGPCVGCPDSPCQVSACAWLREGSV